MILLMGCQIWYAHILLTTSVYMVARNNGPFFSFLVASISGFRIRIMLNSENEFRRFFSISEFFSPTLFLKAGSLMKPVTPIYSLVLHIYSYIFLQQLVRKLQGILLSLLIQYWNYKCVVRPNFLCEC